MDLVTDDHNNTECHEKARDGEADAETDEIGTFKFWRMAAKYKIILQEYT